MKNNKIYRSIGEVAKEILVNTHTLRFWEKEFKQIRPKILNGNRRYYDVKNIEILKVSINKHFIKLQNTYKLAK